MRKDIKQVVITGAGASMPYGFPSGKNLIRDISNNFYNYYHEYFTEKKITIGFQKTNEFKELNEFIEGIKSINGISIDKYLNINTKYMNLGLKAICAEILRYEKKAKDPFHYNINGDWYTYVYSKMLDGLDNKSQIKEGFHNNITFITFNYDRSFENYIYTNLFNLLKNIYSSLEINEIANSLKIMHVYGKLGCLNWQSKGLNEEALEFGGEGYLYEDVLRVYNQINIIYQQREQSAEIEAIKKVIDEADRILFIGFGFDKFNIDTLELNKYLCDKKVFASALDSTENERIHIKNLLCKNNEEIKVLDCDNLMLLREHLIV